MRPTFDIAAYYWPAYHDEPRWRQFMPQGEGEWQIIRESKPKFDGHLQPRVPTWGYGDESDPAVMEQKIQAAADHGVNVFIFDWYWYENQPFLEEALNSGFLGISRVTHNGGATAKNIAAWCNCGSWASVQMQSQG